MCIELFYDVLSKNSFIRYPMACYNLPTQPLHGKRSKWQKSISQLIESSRLNARRGSVEVGAQLVGGCPELLFEVVEKLLFRAVHGWVSDEFVGAGAALSIALVFPFWLIEAFDSLGL